MAQGLRTLLVGFDAACWEYLDPMLQAGRLPTLGGLMEGGAWGVLQSTLPAMTPVAWASIITGKNPGQHGVYDMTSVRQGSQEPQPTSASVRQGVPFWQRLNEAGVRVGLVNVPFTYPPDRVEGFVVCGFGTPSGVSEVAYPAGILEDWPDYRPALRSQFFAEATPGDILEAETALQSQQVEMAIELGRRQKVDVLILNLMLLDHANHCMPDMVRVEEAMERTDRDLARLVEAFPADNVMVFSDHGSRRVRGRFLLYAWLREHGYLTQLENAPGEREEILNGLLAHWLQDQRGWSGLPERAIRRLARRAMLRLPGPLARRFWRAFDAALPLAREHVLLSASPDLERSRVIPGSVQSGLLYLNGRVRHREGAEGTGPGGDLRGELAEDLARITEPDSRRPVFGRIYRAEELYQGPHLPRAPDLILDSYESAFAVVTAPMRRHAAVEMFPGSDHFTRLSQRKDFGRHRREGLFVFAGRDFRQGPAAGEGHVMDLPATLLYLYGVPIPEDYDGQVLAETLSAEGLAKGPVHYQPGEETFVGFAGHPFSAEEEEDLLGHLRALGYVE